MQCSNSFVEVIHIVTDACFLERVSSGMFWSVICDDGNRSQQISTFSKHYTTNWRYHHSNEDTRFEYTPCVYGCGTVRNTGKMSLDTSVISNP